MSTAFLPHSQLAISAHTETGARHVASSAHDYIAARGSRILSFFGSSCFTSLDTQFGSNEGVCVAKSSDVVCVTFGDRR